MAYFENELKLTNILYLKILASVILKQVGGTRWLSWLRRRAVSRRIAGSFPSGVIGIFH
jgi:hypothetical protein